jgi:DNA-binding GntR family transcriptional regulator
MSAVRYVMPLRGDWRKRLVLMLAHNGRKTSGHLWDSLSIPRLDKTNLNSSRRGGLTERVYDHIKQMLVSGSVDRNDWFPIDQIAADLKMSRQPVMDALRRLATEGFIEVVPQVGCRVRQPEIDETRDFFELFAECEAMTAELAATRADKDNILSLRLISSQIGALVNQTAKADVKADMYRRLNRQLHTEIRRAARSPLVAEIVENLGDRSDFFIAAFKDKVFGLNHQVAHAEHEAVIEAIAKGNAKKARAEMKRHILETERRLEAAQITASAKGKKAGAADERRRRGR